MGVRGSNAWQQAKEVAHSGVWLLLGCLLATPVAVAATITGEVRRAAPPNTPVPDARVTVFDASLSLFREARTDASGAYTIPSVPDGAYQIGCAAIDLEYIEEAISVTGGVLQRDFTLGPETHPGVWGIVGDTSPEVLDATDIAVLLPTGEIFYCHDTVDPILFNPVTATKSFPSGSSQPSGCMNGSLLPDGTVLFAGGQNGSDPGDFVLAVPWVKTFLPTSDAWQQLADLQHSPGRWYPGMARLADGSFLVMGGGQCCDAARTDTAERFDLETQTWSYTGSMVNPSEFSPSALLYTGEVLITWSPPQLYNPVSEEWRLTSNFNQPERGWPGHSDHSIIVLDDGRVLAVGILKGATDNSIMAEIYEPSTESWALLSSPGLVRFQSEVVQLPDGRILVAGGETEASPPPVPTTLGIVKWTDIYDPSGDTWRRVADMNHFREYHAVTLLVPDGRVLTTGGTRIKFQVGPTSNDIEAFSPPYLFRGVRPEITSASSTQPQRGDSITLGIAPETQITSAVLIGTQTTTHWVDAGVPRRLVLPVVQTGAEIEIVLPTDPNLLPLGHYMLFAMVDDIPSEAVVVQVLAADAAPAGRIPDANVVPGIPLTVAKASGTDLTLSWGDSCHSPDTDYEIYRGTLGDFETHAPVTCSTGGDTQAVVAAPDPESRYYLVVPRNPSVEGSYGSDSSGQPRDQGAEACLPRLIAGCAS